MQNRIEIFKQMLAQEPENTLVMFGLAKEYEKLGQSEEVIELLETYLARADDEGNAYGMLAKAYEQTGNREKAIATYQKGIEVSNAHGHPSMAQDYQITLDLDYADWWIEKFNFQQQNRWFSTFRRFKLRYIFI